MRDRIRSSRALERANSARDEIERSLWLAKAADHGIDANAVLVGGAAVNLYTGSYRPTDVDMCAHLGPVDRESLVEVGFNHDRGDHFSYTFSDGERWLIEFPDTRVDGDVMTVRLDDEERLDVISLESLVVDRVLQATDGTTVTFDEALRLVVASFEDADWSQIETEVAERARLAPMLRLESVYERIVAEARALLAR